MSEHYNPDLPIVLGLAGGYATGKTVTANGLAPPVRMSFGGGGSGPDITWDHLYFALPLYRMATARQSIEGEHAYDRMAYEIHDTLLEVFGGNPLYGAPGYDQLVQMVYDVMETPCVREGKPRSFLQHVGTEICRAFDSECWVKWMDRKIKEEHRKFIAEHTLTEEEEAAGREPSTAAYGVVVSDCRFRNEAQFVAEHPNGILLRFVARPDIVEQRQLERDGTAMDAKQKSHASEKDLDLIPEEWFTEIIDTSDMTIEEQIQHTKDIVSSFTRT